MNFNSFVFKKHVGRKVVQNDVEQFEDQLMAKLGLAASQAGCSDKKGSIACPIALLQVDQPYSANFLANFISA